jgi:hypothetical protein
MTPCNPRSPMLTCTLCERHNPYLQHLPESRPNTVCIDATVLARKDGQCPLYVYRVVPAMWWNKEAA